MRYAICLLLFMLVAGCASTQARRNLDILETPSSSFQDQLTAIEYFQQKGDPQYVADLIRFLERQPKFYTKSVIALGRQGGPQARKYLTRQWELLEVQSESEDVYAREQALDRMPAVAAGLSLMGDDQHVDVIFELLQSDDEGIRYQAAFVGQFIRTPQMRLALYKTLIGSPRSLSAARCSAAYSLYEMRDPELKAILEMLLAGQEETHECFDALLEELRNPTRQ